MTNNGKLLIDILSYFTLDELLMLQEKVNKLIEIKKVQKELVELLLKK